MTELVSVARMVRTVTTLSGDTRVMGCACAALLTLPGDRWRAERKSLVRFVDGFYPSRVRSLPTKAQAVDCNRVGRAVRESATFTPLFTMPLIGPSYPKSDPRIAQYRPLCESMARRYVKRCAGYYDLDDLIGLAMFGLWRACEAWKPEAGSSFTTYAFNCVRGYLNNAAKYGKRERRIPVNEFLSTSPVEEDDGFFDLRGTEHSPEELTERLSLRATLDKGMAKLDPKQRRVIRQRFFRDATLEEVGAELGVTRERVRQIEVKALEKLRTAAGRRDG